MATNSGKSIILKINEVKGPNIRMSFHMIKVAYFLSFGIALETPPQYWRLRSKQGIIFFVLSSRSKRKGPIIKRLNSHLHISDIHKCPSS